jgi:hypothetical protein
MPVLRTFVILIATCALALAQTPKDTVPLEEVKPGELTIEGHNNTTISGEIILSGQTRWSGAQGQPLTSRSLSGPQKR